MLTSPKDTRPSPAEDAALDPIIAHSVKCFAEAPDDAVLRLPAVEILTGLSERTLRRFIAAGRMEPLVRLGERAVGARVGSVRRLLASLQVVAFDEAKAKARHGEAAA